MSEVSDGSWRADRRTWAEAGSPSLREACAAAGPPGWQLGQQLGPLNMNRNTNVLHAYC